MNFFEILLLIIISILSLFVLCIIFSFICSFFVKNKEYDKNSKFYRFILNSWSIFAVFILRIKIDVKGLEKVPSNSNFVIVGNHRSNYDPIVTWYILRKYNIAYISKESNFKIPCFGKIIRKCCFLSIDRENPRNALKTIEKASDLLKKGEVSIGVYPEGTRNKTDQILLPFHNGVFKIAQKAEVPIVVLCLKGTENISKNTVFRKTNITAEFIDVISKEEVNLMSSKDIGERVKNDLENNLLNKNNEIKSYIGG